MAGTRASPVWSGERLWARWNRRLKVKIKP
jgi:hypothetical protein